MNASSWQNLSDTLMVNKNVTRTRVEPRNALDGVTDTARARRTNVTCIWGVSDPLKLVHGAKKGGWQRGSLTPRFSPTVTVIPAPAMRGAAQSAAQWDRAKCNNDSAFRIAVRGLAQHTSMCVAPCELHSNWGNGAPAFAFPPLSLRFRAV